MKKSSSPQWFRSLALGVLLLTPAIGHCEPVQLLKNSGFQQGDEGWKMQGAIQVTNESGPDGGPIVTLTGSPDQNTITSTPFAVTPKTNYLFAMWARSVTTGQGGATIQFLDKDQKPLAAAEKPQKGVGDEEDDWQNIEFSFDAPENAAFAILILNGGNTGQGRFEISNPKVYMATPEM